MKAHEGEEKVGGRGSLPHQSGGHYRLSCENLNLARVEGNGASKSARMATGVVMVIYQARCKGEREGNSDGRRKKRNSPRIDGRIRGVCVVPS